MVNWVKGAIDGVIVKKLTRHVDKRGFLTETFRLDELPENLRPVMSYVSFTEPGICRGPHEHKEQTDIFTFMGPGNFLIRVWDNRKDCVTYGNFMEIFGGQDSPVTIIVPPGVVHGYKNISRTEQGMVLNFPDRLYMGWGKTEAVDEIRHEDVELSPFSMEE
jgi:dTDP-4-dehydrorhamnose 3,5-epimerase